MKSGPNKPQVVSDTGRASGATRVIHEGRSRLRVTADATGNRIVTKEHIDDAEAHHLHNEVAMGLRLEGVVGNGMGRLLAAQFGQLLGLLHDLEFELLSFRHDAGPFADRCMPAATISRNSARYMARKPPSTASSTPVM